MTDTSDPPDDDIPPKRKPRPKPPSRYANAPYRVGKGKPPPERQFTKGGKPGPGRPRGSANKPDFEKLLDQRIIVGEDRFGRPIRKSWRSIMNLQLMKKVAEGDLKAIKIAKDFELKLEAIIARRGPGPKTKTEREIRDELAQNEMKEKLSKQLTQILAFAATLKREGWLNDKLQLAPWVYEAALDYREKHGVRRDPGTGGCWSPHPEKLRGEPDDD